MFRESMPRDAGMVFLFDGLEIRPFWMKNCHFPLDMIYATKDGTVVDVLKNVPPCAGRPPLPDSVAPKAAVRHRPRGQRRGRGRERRRPGREAEVGGDSGAVMTGSPPRSDPRDVLRSAVNLAAELTRFRDADTGTHLDRVSRYALLIARSLSRTEDLDDQFIAGLSALAPAHDVGKLAIPDYILLKRGALAPAEFEVMKGHVTSGVAVVEELIRDFDLGDFPQVSMLREHRPLAPRSHGRLRIPGRTEGGEIPLEARIVAVADVFDALTTERPYKDTWSQEAAFGFLTEQKGTRFDAACVVAFESHATEVASSRSALRGIARQLTGQPAAGAPIATRMRRICARCTRSWPA